ncbi:hypothetical protein [Acidovorax sp. FG27]|uniref:hypothetical protein n=1 Tax=Acidovorax sp. FG27 TaxID=3133652 RepID=UPI0033409195
MSYSLAPANEYGLPASEHRRAQCQGWITSALNIVHIICPSSDSAYRKRADAVANQDWGYLIHEAVGTLAAILLNLLRDADAGALASIADQALAETFDDFLDHAAAYLSEGRKNEAGAIAGIVFEDTVRRICKKQMIGEKDVKLDLLISELTSKGVLTQAKAKRARASAHVRTKASHAQWDEFDSSDVEATISFARELVINNLDA